jgi:hypothetical protein
MTRLAALSWNRVLAALAATLPVLLLLAPVAGAADAPKATHVDDGSECFRATLAYLKFQPL